MFMYICLLNYLYYLCTIKLSSNIARPIDEVTSYRVKIHKNGGYLYASTQPMIMWVKVCQQMVLGRIREMGVFNSSSRMT